MKGVRDVAIAPRGLAILTVLGAGLVYCSDMIGSGEVILTTRNGAVLGIGVIWAVLVGIFLKYWIGVSGAHYTVCTGEGMMDMFDRIPGPRHWVVWIVLIVQLLAASIATSAIASASGAFVSALVPISPYLAGWLVCLTAFLIAWSGGFHILKVLMSILVALIILGVFYVAATVVPPLSELARAFLFEIPSVPDWAVRKAGVNPNPWREILPMMGWAAGGFGSQVWYTYWVIGEGHGMTRGRGYGRPADLESLRSMDEESARRVKGWCRFVYTDGAIAMGLTAIVTASFLIAGAGILRPSELAPAGSEVAFTLSRLFSERWGAIGGALFMISAAAALISTLTVQLAGWPRLLADAFRICIPGFRDRFAWKTQFRIFLVFLFLTNVVIVYSFGLNPVGMVRLAAVCDGLLLTPLQVIWIAVGLFVVMPRLYSRQVYQILKPHWIFGLFLLLSCIVFSYFVYQILWF